MSDLANIVREWQTQRNNWSNAHRAQTSGLAQPAKPPSISAFAQMMDKAAQKLVALPEFEGFTPLEWESLLELLPNVRKVLGIQGGEGGW